MKAALPAYAIETCFCVVCQQDAAQTARRTLVRTFLAITAIIAIAAAGFGIVSIATTLANTSYVFVLTFLLVILASNIVAVLARWYLGT